MAKYVIVDMDGTIDLGGGRPNQELIEYLRRQAITRRIIIVSARKEGRIEETRAWLKKYKVPHTAVYLRDFDAPPVEFKKYKIGKLLEEGKEVVIAIDNDVAVREMYRKAGVRAIGPGSI
jgi:hypothetical protein